MRTEALLLSQIKAIEAQIRSKTTSLLEAKTELARLYCHSFRAMWWHGLPWRRVATCVAGDSISHVSELVAVTKKYRIHAVIAPKYWFKKYRLRGSQILTNGKESPRDIDIPIDDLSLVRP